MGKRYVIEESNVFYNTVYHIIDNALDSVICTCDTSEQAKLIVNAMNKTYKLSMVNKRGIDVTI